jgi:hypothetical protein
MWTRLERFAPLSGLAFLIIFVALFFTPSAPESDQPAAAMVLFWAKHKNGQIAVALFAGLAAVLLIWFAASVRRLIWRAEGSDGRLATLTFAGHFLAAFGILLFAGFGFVAADTVGKVSVETTQTLTVLANDFFLPLSAGVFLLFAASGFAILRFGVLPQWLGWVCLLLALNALTPFGWFSFLAVALWAGLVGVLLFMRGSGAEAPLTTGVGAQGA